MDKIKTEGNRGLLFDYLDKKVKQYVEPTREGTPRGEAIGLSATKYLATILALTNHPQKTIAAELKISHGLLRKWHTEDQFKEMVDKHCREFSELLIKYLHDKINEHMNMYEDFFKKSYQDIAQESPPSMDFSGLTDSISYSDKLYLCILTALNTATLSTDDLNFKLTFIRASDVLEFYRGERKNPKYEKEKKDFLNSLLKNMVEQGIDILCKNLLSEDDRRYLLMIMKNLQNHFK